MERIIVPTDFSDNSKPGLRFAIRLAARGNVSLTFLHVLQIKRPFVANATEDDFERQKAEQIQKAQAKLEGFVRKIYQSLKVDAGEYQCEIIEGIKADICLIDYCRKHPDVKYIAISTRGASYMKKVLGTNTGNLIAKSPVPVIAVPKDYRFKPLQNVVYATDLENVDAEFEKVMAFARPKGLSIELLHFYRTTPDDLPTKVDLKDMEMKAGVPLMFHMEKNDPHRPLTENLQDFVRKTQPSMVILFTRQHRSFFENLFLSSKSEDLSFKIQTPLLVFNK
jgi:nucleotide-binding universal stress UspA family protein